MIHLSVTELLDDYDISGKHIPSWVSKFLQYLAINGEIRKSDFANYVKIFERSKFAELIITCTIDLYLVAIIIHFIFYHFDFL